MKLPQSTFTIDYLFPYNNPLLVYIGPLGQPRGWSSCATRVSPTVGTLLDWSNIEQYLWHHKTGEGETSEVWVNMWELGVLTKVAVEQGFECRPLRPELQWNYRGWEMAGKRNRNGYITRGYQEVQEHFSGRIRGGGG